MFQLLDHCKIDEIKEFIDISVSPFHFTNMSSKYIANLAASDVTDALRKHCIQRVRITLLAARFAIFLLNMLAKLKGETEKSTYTSISL